MRTAAKRPVERVVRRLVPKRLISCHPNLGVIMELDDINPNEVILMSVGLQRLFKVAGCSPTSCHACGDTIKVGETFKLLTHTKDLAGATATDEMCCQKCGVLELQARDSKKAIEKKPTVERGFWSSSKPRNATVWKNGQDVYVGGYSRPSKKV